MSHSELPNLNTLKDRFRGIAFHPVMALPQSCPVLDLSRGPQLVGKVSGNYAIGKYDESRPHLYTSELYEPGRQIHMGIDLMAPVGDEVFSFFPGEIYSFQNNRRPLDYGYTLITKHDIAGIPIWALYGHLSESSLEGKDVGDAFLAGHILGCVGSENENGGWPSHLHFQLSLVAPIEADLPGVVNEENRKESLRIYPDPRIVLGEIY